MNWYHTSTCITGAKPESISIYLKSKDLDVQNGRGYSTVLEACEIGFTSFSIYSR